MKLLFILIFIFFDSLSAYEVLRDKSGLLTIKDVASKNTTFQTKENLHFKHTNDTIWVKYPLHNAFNYPTEKAIQLQYAATHMNFYEKKDDGFSVYKAGYLMPKNKNVIYQVHNSYTTSMEPNEEKVIYIQIQSKMSTIFTLKEFDSKEEFYYASSKYNTISIAFIAIMIAFLIYNTFIYLITKDKIYAYYITYLLFVILFQLVKSSVILDIFGGGEYFYILLVISISLTFIFLIFFMKEILRTKELSYKLDIVLNIFIGIFMLFPLIFIFDGQLLQMIRNALIVPLMLLVITYTIVLAIIKKVLYAQYILLGWSVFILCVFYIAIYSSFGLPSNFISHHGMLIATVLEVVVFSIVLALRFQKIKLDSLLKDELLQRQSKEAQMGELLGMVAHQWKQPLSIINTSSMSNLVSLELSTLTKDSMKECLTKTMENSSYLAETIDEFRSFFRTDRIKEFTKLSKPINRAVKILEGTLKSHGVLIQLDIDTDKEVEVFPNEITQVMLNIIKNADDNFVENKTEDARVHIKLFSHDTNMEVHICDNGGGIDESALDKIFLQDYTTKDEATGTGIGLYMSKRIIEEHHNGKLYTKNIDDGICFIIELPQNI
ncbi:ATP-binding protein [Sulfurimonas sp.]|nr:ATP-binding protein [Sulfurimonas sp.]